MSADNNSCYELQLLFGIRNFLSVDFVFATAREMKLEMSSEVWTGTSQNYRNGGKLKKM